jgi:RNA polymerase sigma-70 factor, ECF subfamily
LQRVERNEIVSRSLDSEPSSGVVAVPSALHLAGADDGQAVTLEALMQRYERYVAGIAVRLLGRDDQDIDDVVQDVFWKAWRHLPSLTDMQAARGWLAVVTTRVVRRKRVRRRFRRFFHVDSPSEDVPAPGASAEEMATLTRVYAELDRLPIDDRLAWSLRYIEGEQLGTVAEACGCSLATAKRRIQAAQGALREVLADG